MMLATDLQKRFGIPDQVSIVDLAPDYPVININNAHASAQVALHGGHVMSFQPHGHEPVLWLSGSAVFAEGKAIRGGIPVCWPWFADHPSDASLPAHGLVRSQFWELQAVDQLDDGATQITLSIQDTPESRTLWAHAFKLELVVTIADSLRCRLRMTNKDKVNCDYTGALHTYLQVGDISQLKVSGLDGVDYLDKLADDKRIQQQGDITVDAELDRIYTHTDAEVVVNDTALNRKICVQKQGSQTTVIWNPWLDKSAAMTDFEVGGYQHMLCVEAANAVDDIVRLAPGETHVLETRLSVKK